jgi:hypothetical protein
VPALSSQQTAELVESIREALRHLERARARLQARWCYSCAQFRAAPRGQARCDYWGDEVPVEHRETGCDMHDPDVPF